MFASSGKPLGDGIYWQNSKDETQSSSNAKSNSVVSPDKQSQSDGAVTGSVFSPNQTGTHSAISQMKSSKILISFKSYSGWLFSE